MRPWFEGLLDGADDEPSLRAELERFTEIADAWRGADDHVRMWLAARTSESNEARRHVLATALDGCRAAMERIAPSLPVMDALPIVERWLEGDGRLEAFGSMHLARSVVNCNAALANGALVLERIEKLAAQRPEIPAARLQQQFADALARAVVSAQGAYGTHCENEAGVRARTTAIEKILDARYRCVDGRIVAVP